MKRICCVLLALLLLAGCGAQAAPPTTVTTVPPTTAPAPTAAELTVDGSAENDTLAMTLISVDAQGQMGYTATFSVKNKTDRALTVKLKSLAVNDCVSHKQWRAELPALGTVECQLAIVDDSYKLGGTEQPEKLEVVLAAENTELWTVFYPGGAAWEAKPFTPDLVLVENEDLTIGVAGYDPADPLGYGVTLYLENKTRDDLLFDLGETKVDNFPCQPLFAGMVPSGKRSFAVVSWYLADLQKLGIEAPSKLELPFAVYDIDNYLAEPLLEETFELTPVWE